MLMRNPEYQENEPIDRNHSLYDPTVAQTPRELLLGQIVLILLLGIAILLRATT